MGSLRYVVPAWCLLVACGDSGGGSTGGSTDAGDTGATAAETDPAPTDPSGASTTAGGEAVRPNWHEDVAPLVAKHCQSCHAAGGIAPFPLTSYEEAKGWAPIMALDVEEGLMPPWHALETDVCAPPFKYKHDARLSADEKDVFTMWSDAGAPEGDPELAAPLPDPPSLDLADATVTVAAKGEVTIEKVASQLDFFHCLSIDPGNTETVYLDGLQVVPGNREIVHHVLIYVDAEAQSAGWDNGVKTNCGGGSGIAGGQLIGGWVPGGMPMEAPADVGTEMPAGTRLILNVHYHAPPEGPATDKGTGLALRWSTTPPAWQTYFTLIGAPGVGQSLNGPLMIPAGEQGHVEEYEYTVAENVPDIVDVRVWTVLNHMHKVGVDMRAWVVDRDSGEETCLLHTPRWDFNWQRSYAFDAEIGESVRVRGGDKVRVRCVYDNTTANPGVQAMLMEAGLDAPVDVGLGEGTLDEMCLAGVGVAIRGGLP
jgi:hypothetical protein